MQVRFQTIEDGHGSGDRLAETFCAFWPAYKRWLRRSEPVDARACIAKLREHMPELVPVLESLVARFTAIVGTHEQDDVTRFLTLWNPPPLVRACSQLIYECNDNDHRTPMLIRSYDHHPKLFDGVVLASEWLDRRTLAMSDCIWGALDGINDHGLAIALAFGGRRVVANGFAAPLIVRYILETCSTVEHARQVLLHVPVSMPYTFSVVDEEGDFVTAFLSPQRTPRLIRKRAATNHQGEVEWGAYARRTASVERLDTLESLLGDRLDNTRVEQTFLTAPIWRTDPRHENETLYVSRYSTRTRDLDLLWPDGHERVSLTTSAGHGLLFQK